MSLFISRQQNNICNDLVGSLSWTASASRPVQSEAGIAQLEAQSATSAIAL